MERCARPAGDAPSVRALRPRVTGQAFAHRRRRFVGCHQAEVPVSKGLSHSLHEPSLPNTNVKYPPELTAMTITVRL